MSIEGISNKAELEAFIADQVRSLPAVAVQGLPGALAARYASQHSLTGGAKALSETPAAVAGAAFTAPENMTCWAYAGFDVEGPALGYIYVNGESVKAPEAVKVGSTTRFSFATDAVLTLKKGDVVQLYVREYLGEATVWDHTHLSIVRLT